MIRANSIPVPFPIKGVAESTSFGRQPEGTTPYARNVRAFDPTTGRLTGAQRGGITKFNTNRLNGTNPVSELAMVVKHDDRLTYTVRTSPQSVWSKPLPSGRSALCVATDRQSNLYVVGTEPSGGTGINYVSKINSSGVVVWTYPVPLLQNTHLVKSIKVDLAGGIYLAIAGTGTNGRVIKLVPVEGEERLRLAWTIDSPNGAMIPDVAVYAGTVYFIENTNTQTNLHRYDGAYSSAPELVWSVSALFTVAAGNAAIAIDTLPDGSVVVASPHASGQGALKKVGPQGGSAVWTYTGDGTGWSIVTDGDGMIYTHGKGTGGTPKHVAKVKDNGTTATLQWSIATTEPVFQGVASVAIDDQKNVYQAVYNGGSGNVVHKINADGAAIAWTYTGISSECYALAVDPAHTDNGGKAEYLYVCSDPDGSSNTVHKLRLCDVSTVDGSPRSPVYLGVSNGSIVRFPRGSGSVTTPTGGSSALSTSARWVTAAAGFNRVLFTDGQNYKSYDALTDTVTAWAAADGGQIPGRGRLLALWGGCAVVAGFEDQPQNWAMSEQGNVDGWDFFPPVLSETQAVLGNDSRAGLCPDIITSLIPYNDDLILFGGDHTIHRLTGHPMQGGKFDLVSDITGVAFGRAWCKDERGVLYFFGSRGGVFRYAPGMQPEPISSNLTERFASVDVGATNIRLVWNDREECVHVFLTPYAGGACEHAVWCRRTDEWEIDTYGSTDMNPRSVLVADGDAPDDRQILLGGGDGYVRAFDLDATSDDGVGIASDVYLGPILAAGDHGRFKLHDLRAVLATGSSTTEYAVYAAETPLFSAIGTARFSGTWAAGRNASVLARASGQAVWVRMGRYTSPSAGRWALENLTADVLPAGQARVMS